MRREVNTAKKAIRTALEEAVKEAAHSVRDDAKKLVPQDTGTLHNNIIANVTGFTAKVGVFDDESYYGQFVEFGTSSQRAQPFMTPASELERKRFVERLRRHVGKRL